MNHRINRQAWDACMAALKPTRKQLEHGLGLHAESVVVDAYGLGIYARPSRKGALDILNTLELKMKEGASVRELIDFQEEMGQIINITDGEAWKDYLNTWESSGVTCIFQNAGEESQNPLRIIRRLARHTLITDLKKEFVFKAASPQDMRNAKKENKHCLYLSANGVPLVQKWEAAENELDFIHLFFQMGIRMMHLTYNRRNMLGDGCGEKANAGLSDFGRMAIREMNKVGVIVDIAHSGWKTSSEAAEVSSRPVVASHSACASLNMHYRCKTDQVIRSIADSGGYIGICCYDRFLGQDGGINALMNHIDYAAKKFGADYVAIGTDRCSYGCRKLTEKEKVPQFIFPKMKPAWESLWPEVKVSRASLKQFEKSAATIEWTNWPLFTVGLVQKGYPDSDIRKIIGGNVLRVAEANLAGLPYIR